MINLRCCRQPRAIYRDLVLVSLICSLLTQPRGAEATWRPDGVPLGPPRTAQIYPRLAPDGAGGSIIVWQDNRSCASVAAIYAQRFDATGHALWGTDGTPVATAVGAQTFPQVVSDMAGGAILFWQDNRGSDTDIYAQRLSSTGAALWAPDGIPICTKPDDQSFGQPYTHAAVSDGMGGALVAWTDSRTAATTGVDIYIQHVKDSGVRTFPVDGLPVCTAPGGQLMPAITGDGAGGAVVAWTDDRGGGDVYAQRITAAGSAAWTSDGAPVCAAAGLQWFVDLVGDGSGGAIITWQDSRGVNDDIYAQRVSSGGTVLWSPSDGVNLSPVPGLQMAPQIVSDGASGAIIAFTDRGVDPSGDIHAQRVNGSGALLWLGISGVTICGVTGEQDVQRILADGAGGAIVSWEDKRSGPYYDLYAQRINPGGTPSWSPSTGVAISTAPYQQQYDDVVSDGSGGAILVWEDRRSGLGVSDVGFDIYARRVNSAGFALWDPDGDVVSAPGAAQRAPAIVADGLGGTLFAWEDYRIGCIGKIYAQGLDASGNLTWGADGGPLADLGTGSQQGPKMCTDGWASRGAYVVWTDFRNGNADIYAQHMDGTPGVYWSGGFGLGVCVNPSPQITPNIVACESGGAIIVWDDERGGADVVYAQKLLDTGAVAPGWPTDGLPVVTATNATKLIAPQVVSDGADGCIVTWQDGRAGNFDIYAQRIDAAGARRWVISGLALCAATGDQTKPQIVSDGAGGAIVTWEDNRAGNTDVYARRVDSTGSPLWALDGVLVYADANAQSQPVIAIDGVGGAIVAWRDDRGGTQDVYAQRLNSSGAALWPSGGVAVCAGPGPQQDPAIISDGAHGAVIAWRDARSGQDDIYTQRLDGAGTPHCSACGIGVCTATAQQYENVLAPDGAGGAIVAWTDYRSTRADDIEVYASRFAPECGSYATGVHDAPTLAAADRLIQNRPNPFNPTTVISYSLVTGGHVNVSIFDFAGRRVRTLLDTSQSAGPQHVMWNGDLDSGGRAATGPYFYVVTFPDGKRSSKKMLLLR